MDWGTIVTIAMSAVAIGVAVSAKKQANDKSTKQLEIQQRAEIYQFYPMIEPTLRVVDNQIELTIANESDTNSASGYEVKYVFRIFAEEISVDIDGSYKGKEIRPKTKDVVFPKRVNEVLADSLPFIFRCPPEKLHIVARFIVRYDANQKGSPTLTEEKTIYLTHRNGKLVKTSSKSRS
ncbi:hypothetical protein ACPV4Z_16545 [Vibrio aestuarianus]|uniref:hypothetical protein n=1 Tax=Vibrio aestuarianus TaxID=28171 RepID=UPI00406878E6